MTEPNRASQSQQSPAPPAAAERLSGYVLLRDGSRAYLRPIRRDDAPRLQAAFAHLSPETVLHRFFSLMPELKATQARHFAEVDYTNRMALVATTSADMGAEGLAVVRYDCTSATSAEIAFVVVDAWQGRGLAFAMLWRLVPYARAQGIEQLVAVVMPDNQHMLSLLRKAGLPLTSRIEGGAVVVTLDISDH